MRRQLLAAACLAAALTACQPAATNPEGELPAVPNLRADSGPDLPRPDAAPDLHVEVGPDVPRLDAVSDPDVEVGRELPQPDAAPDSPVDVAHDAVEADCPAPEANDGTTEVADAAPDAAQDVTDAADADAAAPEAEVQLPPQIHPLFLLTDNIMAETDLALPTGVTYVAYPPYTSPTDTTGRRLLDAEAPWSDWNNAVGIFYTDSQTVTFDLQAAYEIEKVWIGMMEAFPASISASVSMDGIEGWSPEVEVTDDEFLPAPCVIDLSGLLPKGRFVRLTFKLNVWGWVVKEVRIYGRPPETPAEPAASSPDGLELFDSSGLPHATIVVADEPSLDARLAAGLLQQTLYLMTTVAPPIRQESWYDGKSAALLVGPSALADSHGLTVVQDRLGGDHYLLQTGADWAGMVGNDDAELTGTGYAVFDLLQRLGCGWYVPEPQWYVIPPAAYPLTVAALDVEETADFDRRYIWAIPGWPAWSTPMKYALRYGGREVGIGAHSLDYWVPKAEVQADHPEWYPEGAGQPDMCNPEVIDYVADKMRAIIDSKPPGTMVEFNIGQNDTSTWVWTEYTAACGNNQAAHMMYFANSLAQELATTHPGQYSLAFLAYWVDIVPPDPPMQAEDQVIVFFVNQGDHTLAMNDPASPVNLNYSKLLEQWIGTGADMGTYSYFIPWFANPAWFTLPWYGASVMIDDLHYWHDIGVRFVAFESCCEQDYWPIRWPLYDATAAGAWDSDVSYVAFMTEACMKLFGNAWEPMYGFYDTIAGAMPHGGGSCGWCLPAPVDVFTPEVVETASEFLDEALGQPIDQRQAARITEELAMWTAAKATMEAIWAGE